VGGRLFVYRRQNMAQVISDLDDAIDYINALYESDSTAPTSGDEDYLVWTSLVNIAVDLWENEEGILWKELFVKLEDAADGDKTVTAGDYSYVLPTNFRFPASGFVWLGTGTNKTAFQVIKQEDLVLYENDMGNWCYFLMDTTPTLEFNPNCTLTTGDTLSYNYYKKATALTTGASTFEMSDPMFAVYYVLSELKKEEGDTSAALIATQKLEGMKTRNSMPTWYQPSQLSDNLIEGFGV
jgi:hypothetical protein